MKRTALITGSSRGIGREIALTLAKEGFNIVLNYVSDKASAEDTASVIKKTGVDFILLKADVSSSADVATLKSEAEKKFGFIDTVVNNAGVSSYGLLDAVTDEEYNRVMDINLKGSFNICRAFYFPMVSHKFGRIVNISSMWGLSGASLEVVYSASKAGVIGLTKALAKELAPSNITVNAIAPGVIKTDMLNNLTKETIDELISETPIGRLGYPKDIAEVVKFLVKESGDFITGQVINASGGFLV